MPRVSVTICTYNCATYLARAIDSALAQTYQDHEIVVVDDGSIDDTRELVARYTDDRVRYFYRPNGGLSAARNLSLDKSTGEFIAYLDADDMFYPTRLARQVEFLDAHRECGFVHSDVTILDEHDRVLHRGLNQSTGRIVPKGHCPLDLIRRCHIQVPSVLERRQSIERVGQFDTRLTLAQDYLHWIAIVFDGMSVGYLDEPLAFYRWRQDSLLLASPRGHYEDLVRIFEIVLTELRVGERLGAEAHAAAKHRLMEAQRFLAYLEREDGAGASARRRIAALIQEAPLSPSLYLDWLKAALPQPVASTLKRVRFGG